MNMFLFFLIRHRAAPQCLFTKQHVSPRIRFFPETEKTFLCAFVRSHRCIICHHRQVSMPLSSWLLHIHTTINHRTANGEAKDQLADATTGLECGCGDGVGDIGLGNNKVRLLDMM